MKLILRCCVAVIGLITASSPLASGGGPKVAEGVNYIPLEPALVVNYGGPGKTRFIRAEISIRTETGENAIEVMHHLPLIRDRLVSILSAQTEETISSTEGKEHLRVHALAEINKALLKVDGHDVDELHATNGANKTVAEAKPAHEDKRQGDEAPSEDSAVGAKPVEGPASDLYFNNFVVQK